MREVADEEGAIRVADELGIAQGVIKASGGAKEGSVDSVVVRENVGAVYASRLNRMIRLRVEN